MSGTNAKADQHATSLETADAALLHERVSGIAELIDLSRATLANVNVAIAVGLKLIFLATTLLGVTGLWMAILADTGATVLVTVNALRLLSWRSPFAGHRARAHPRQPMTRPGAVWEHAHKRRCFDVLRRHSFKLNCSQHAAMPVLPAPNKSSSLVGAGDGDTDRCD